MPLGTFVSRTDHKRLRRRAILKGGGKVRGCTKALREIAGDLRDGTKEKEKNQIWGDGEGR